LSGKGICSALRSAGELPRRSSGDWEATRRGWRVRSRECARASEKYDATRLWSTYASSGSRRRCSGGGDYSKVIVTKLEGREETVSESGVGFWAAGSWRQERDGSEAYGATGGICERVVGVCDRRVAFARSGPKSNRSCRERSTRE